MAAHDSSTDDNGKALDRLREIVSDIRIAMVTTEGTDAAMHSRPMYLQEVDAQGDLWFATSSDSPLAEQIRDNSRVIATFANPSDHLFAVIRGSGSVMRDQAKIEALWTPAMTAWFPNGPTDPNIALVRVRGEHGDYWDAPGMPARIVKYVSAIFTGTRADGGERKHVDLAS